MIDFIANHYGTIAACLVAVYALLGIIAKATENKIDNKVYEFVGDLARKYGPDVTRWFHKRKDQ